MKKTFSLVAVALLSGAAFADELAEGVYYIKSATSDVYLTRGQSWGTQAVVEPYGHPWEVKLADGQYKLYMHDIYTAGEKTKGFGANAFVDTNPPTTFTFEAGTVEGSYKISLAPNESNAIVLTETHDWLFLSAADYNAAQASATAAQEATVASAAGIDLAGASLSDYLAENYATKAITTGFAPVPVNGGTDWTFTIGRDKSALKYGNYGIECYQGSGSLAQTISNLKPGIYKVGIKAMQRSVSNEACYTVGQEGYTNSGSYLSANGKTVNIKDWYSSCTAADVPNSTDAELEIANNGGYYSEVYTYVGEDGVLDVKVSFPSYWTYSWFIFNGIDLVYYLDKSSGTTLLIEEFDGLVAKADSLLALPMADDVKTALEAAKATPAEETVDAYNAAISTLRAAIDVALVSTKKFDNVEGHDVSALAPAAWTAVQGNDAEKKAYLTGWQTWGGTAFQPGKVIYQSIDGLVPGAAYDVQFYAVANVAWITAATGEGIAQVYANGATYDINVIGQTGCTPASDEYLYEFKNVTVGKDGVLEFGMQNVAEGGNWYVAQVKSIVSAGNTNVASYATAYIGIDAIRDAITAAAGQITNDTYAEIVAQYAELLNNFSAQVDRAAFVADSLYNEVAISGKADSIIGLLPTVEEVENVVTSFNEAIAANQHIAVKKAKLLHTASVNWGASPSQSLDGELAHYNNNSASTASNSWAGVAFAEFDFKGLNAKTITKATLTWTTITGGRANTNRNNKVYYLTPGTELPYDAIEGASAECLFEESRTLIETYVGMNTFVGTLDVAPAIEAALAAGKTNIIFQWTDNAAGADLAGKASENAPTLEIEFDMAPSLKTTLIQNFEAAEVAGWTANSAAACSIGEADGNHYAAAVQNGSGNRGAYYDASTTAIKTTVGEDTSWAIEWDLKIQSGNVKERSIAVFGLGTTESAYPANSNALTNMFFTMQGDQNQEAAVNKVWYITNPISAENIIPDEVKLATVELDPTVFYHYQLVYDNGKVTVTISNGSEVVATASYTTTYTLADLRGFVTCVGRGSGYVYLDNIAAGVYTYDEIIEDPVITAAGESYDPLTITITTETDGATIKYTIDGGEEQVYEAPFVINQTSTIAAWAEKNGSASNVITKKFVACVTPAPTIANAGETFGANTITITSNVPSAVTYYTINDGDIQTYTDEFVTDESITVAAWNVYEERSSDTTYLSVTAGEIATPVVTLTNVDGGKRNINFTTATDTAKIVYVLNDGDEVVGNQGTDEIVIESDTKIKVWARFVENEKVFESAAVDTVFQAGTQIQLAGVDITTEDYSAVTQTADLKLSTSQLEILLNPAVEINWAYGDQSGVAANGDVIKNVPVGATFTAYAKATGYVDSEVSSVEIVPSYASTIFNEDYEDGTTGSWTMQIAGMLYNVENTDGTHSLNFSQSNQGGDRWAKLVFPEYSSSAYTLSFKWAIAAGNGATNRFYVYAGSESDILFRFETGTDMDTNPGERVTTVYDKDDNVIGTFTLMQSTRFVLPEKYASVEVAVSASGAVLTIVNDRGQTQIKTKVSEEPVVITELHEILGRAYGYWAVDDVKIAGRSGAVMAPEFALDHYEVCDPAVVMTDATDKTEIYYRAASTTYSYDEDGNIVAGEYTFPEEYTKYEAPVVFTNEATIVEAYAVYEGVVESPKALSTVFLKLTELAAPTVAFVSADATEATNTFSVVDNTSDLISATLYYQGIGQESASVFEDTQITTDPAAYGWFNVYAQVGDLKSPVVYRYVDARGVYTEPYVGIFGSENVFPETIGDFEAAVGATVSGAYPENYLSITGTQYVHVALTENYSVVTLPFTFTVGTNVITNAKGETLALNEDYELYTLHTRAAQNTNNNKDLSLLANVVTIANAKRGEGVSFSENVAVLIRPLTEKVGSEIVLHSSVAAPIKANVGNATVPSNGGWRIFANGRYENIALESAAYILDAAGEKFVYTENPVIPALGAAIIIDPASVASFGNEIILVGDPSGIENIASDAVESYVYDLQGRKAQSAKKGIFVIDGKAVLVK